MSALRGRAALRAGGPVGRVYAEALFAIAKEANAIDSIGEDLRAVGAVLRENPGFRALYESPELSREETERMLRETFGDALEPAVLNLLLLLVRKRRQAHLGRIAEAYDAIVEEERNERRVTLVTAAPLEEPARARLAALLSAKTGARVILDERPDPAVLGGVLARVGDTLVDGTLRAALGQLARHMEAGNHHTGA